MICLYITYAHIKSLSYSHRSNKSCNQQLQVSHSCLWARPWGCRFSGSWRPPGCRRRPGPHSWAASASSGWGGLSGRWCTPSCIGRSLGSRTRPCTGREACRFQSSGRRWGRQSGRGTGWQTGSNDQISGWMTRSWWTPLYGEGDRIQIYSLKQRSLVPCFFHKDWSCFLKVERPQSNHSYSKIWMIYTFLGFSFFVVIIKS